MLAAPDGMFRLWLRPGAYTVVARVGLAPANPLSIRQVSSGGVDLRQAPLRVDGVTPVSPILITVE
jgi:hypothetical protein